jgi:hypothetical protein
LLTSEKHHTRLGLVGNTEMQQKGGSLSLYKVQENILLKRPEEKGAFC